MKNIYFIICFMGIFLFFTAKSNAENYEDIFYKANKLYAEKKYEEAKEEYLKITNIKLSSIYYNLASSYFMTGDNGRSVLWYERALKLSPFDKETEATLEMNTGRKSYLKIIKILNYGFSFLFLFGFLFFMLLFTIFIINKKTRQDKMFKRVLIFMFISIFSFIFLIALNKTEKTNYIIATEETSLYRGNSKNSDILKNVSSGEKIKVLEEYDNWYYVKNKLGAKGWIEKSKSEKI